MKKITLSDFILNKITELGYSSVGDFANHHKDVYPQMFYRLSEPNRKVSSKTYIKLSKLFGIEPSELKKYPITIED